LNNSKIRAFTTKWDAIQTDKAKIGLRESVLLSEIRGEFPPSKSGDLQFMEWCKDHLNTTSTGPSLLRKARAPQILGTSFKDVVDWAAAATLLNFSRGERTRILKTIKASGKRLSQSVVKSTGYGLGYRAQHQNGGARKTTYETMKQRDLLRTFIHHLYGNYENLPTIPDHIRVALGTKREAKTS
jgi:hypothetical protein